MLETTQMGRRRAAKGAAYCLILGGLFAAVACSGTTHEFTPEAGGTSGSSSTAGNPNSAGKSANAGSANAGSSNMPLAGRGGSDTSAGGDSSDGGTGDTASTGGAPDAGGSAGSSSEAGSAGGPLGGSGGAAGSSGAAGSGGTAAACPATHQCVARAPAGWSGPVIFATKSALPSCPASYPTTSVTGGTGVTGSTNCQCACSATPQSSSCAAVTLTNFLDGGCSTSNGSGSLSANACFDAGGGGISHRLTITAPTAQCAGGTSSPLAAPTFTNPVLACGGATENAGTCASSAQACLPKPPAASGADVCIYKTGVVDCPDDYSASAQLVYKSWADTRTCPASCTCTGSGGTCTANRQKFGIQGCSVASGGPVAFTSAQAATCLPGDSFTSMQVGAPTVATAPTCSGGTQTAGGSLVGSGAVTVCCR